MKKGSKNYFFVCYQHQLYDEDDDRAVRIGVGPLVFYKNNGEYKLSGTGDLLGGSYDGEMEEAYSHIKNADSIYAQRSIPEIIAGIQRRKYVNLLDAHFLLSDLKDQCPDIDDSIKVRRDISYSEYFLFISNNQDYSKAVTDLWDSFGFDYHWINDELLLHRVK